MLCEVLCIRFSEVGKLVFQYFHCLVLRKWLMRMEPRSSSITAWIEFDVLKAYEVEKSSSCLEIHCVGC